jgi:YHS domain-containing protein
LKGYFDTTRPAVVQRDARTQVNYEFFYFADAESKQRFDGDPLRWCGTVTDPISRQRFRPTQASARTEHNGVPFFFESQETQLQFAAHPDSFAVMHQKMFETGAD